MLISKSTNKQIDFKLFQKYIVHCQQNKSELIFNIRTSKFTAIPRFNVWRLLLQIISFQTPFESKLASLQSYRKRWHTLNEQSKSPTKLVSKQGPISVSKNPLFKGVVKSQKKQPQSDSFLLEEIRKDVSRTYQQLQFFQHENVQKILSKVLFVWCKINSDVSYKQGMNELLASIVWVYFQEGLANNFVPNSDLQKHYFQFHNPEHAEADIFAVFEKMMQVQKQMFKQSLDSQVKGIINPNAKNNSPILQRISQIQDHKLKILDIELYRALKLQDVKTKTFLLRWIRCLHTREFGLEGSLPIWDSILLDHYESLINQRAKKHFQFIDAMCLSMFIYVRSIVLKLETTNEITTVYQKYPKLEGQFLQELLGLAWSLSQQLRSLTTHGISSQKDEESKTPKKHLEKDLRKPAQHQPILKKQQSHKNTKQVLQNDSDQKKQIIIDSIQLKSFIDKLSQSNTYNQNAQSKKLVRSVIDILQNHLNA